MAPDPISPQDMQRITTITRRSTLLQDALDVLETDYARSLSLDDVAHRIATSRRQLQRCFDEHHAESFRGALTRIRMRNAAELLRTTPLSVREVAARVGYRQPAQFAKAFARVHGVAPSEYRAREGRPYLRAA